MLGVSEDNKTMPYQRLLLQKFNINYKKCHNINEHPAFKAIEQERQQSLMRFLNKHKEKELNDGELFELTKLCGIVTKSIKGIAQTNKINICLQSLRFKFQLCNITKQKNNTKYRVRIIKEIQ